MLPIVSVLDSFSNLFWKLTELDFWGLLLWTCGVHGWSNEVQEENILTSILICFNLQMKKDIELYYY